MTIREPVLEPSTAEHWDAVYAARELSGHSWHQADPTVSVELLDHLRLPRTAAIVDVGGGASLLADTLVARGHSDVTVLDISATALALAQRHLTHAHVHWRRIDVLDWHPVRRYDVWHDRAVFHFLVDAHDRSRYVDVLRRALGRRGHVVIATFAADGPTSCSGLPTARYDADDLVAALGGGLHVLEVRREEHVTPAGVVQPFTWLSAQLRQD